MAKRILVVDDDTDTREILSLLFRMRGYAVDTAADGEQALRVARGEPPCAILLDLMMPVMDGESFRRAQLADAQLRTIPVVCISGRHDIERTSEVLQFSGWFNKPLPFQRLVTTVESLCARCESWPPVARRDRS
jgi:DNA-binding response OmpR family regulator